MPKDSLDIISHTDLIGVDLVTSVEFDALEACIYDFLFSFRV